MALPPGSGFVSLFLLTTIWQWEEIALKEADSQATDPHGSLQEIIKGGRD